jgi:hypothetical protein
MKITEEFIYADDNCEGFRYNLFNSGVKIAYLNIMIYKNTKSSIITDFYSMKTNKGYGSILLKELINKMEKLSIKNILLDDMTDRYRKAHNIYLKFCFEYICENGPEMQLIINTPNVKII